MPPYSRLIALIVSSKKQDLSLQGAKAIKVKLNTIKEIEVLGPVESPLLKIKKIIEQDY